MIPILSGKYPSCRSPFINPVPDITFKLYILATISLPIIYFPVDSVITLGNNTSVIFSSISVFVFCVLFWFILLFCLITIHNKNIIIKILLQLIVK